MSEASKITFVHLSDGTILERQPDGSFRPTIPLSDLHRLATLTEDEIEEMASSDPDHPASDDEVLANAYAAGADAVFVDPDLASFFKQDRASYQAQINAVLRRFVEAQRKAG